MERLFHVPLFRKMSQAQGEKGLFSSEHTDSHTPVLMQEPHSPIAGSCLPASGRGKVMASQWEGAGGQGRRQGGEQVPEYHDRLLDETVEV